MTIQYSVCQCLTLLLICCFLPTADASPLEQQWRQGLSGAKLTAYSGSAISSNSTLTVINLCSNGRYTYHREGSWSIPGTAGGASDSRIAGAWDVRETGGQMQLVYRTDGNEAGAFPLYLQSNGRINIGGMAYAIEAGAASC